MVVAACFVGCDPHAAPAAAAPTLADARALLTRHAAAVLAHDPQRYLADVSSATSSAAFRERERTDITDLAGVPLRSWAYADLRPVDDASARAAATRRYGAPVLFVHAALRYALDRVDPLPTAHDVFLTFVRSAGDVVLAGDSDLATTNRTSWAGPWRYEALSAVRGARCLVLGPSGASLRQVADAVDAAVPQVSAVWGTGWNQDVAVLITGSDTAFAAAVGSSEQLEDVSAAAVTDGVDPVSHRPYGQRLVLAPNAVTDLSGTGTRIVVRHELTHLATAAVTDPTTPRWIVEGFAEYVANLGTGQPVGVAASELRSAVLAGRSPTTLPADSAFAAKGAALARAYEQAWLAARLVAQLGGQDALVRFYRAAAGALLPVAEAVATGLRDATGLSVAAFTARWRAYVRTELG